MREKSQTKEELLENCLYQLRINERRFFNQNTVLSSLGIYCCTSVATLETGLSVQWMSDNSTPTVQEVVDQLWNDFYTPT
jgi:hypothetical protein